MDSSTDVAKGLSGSAAPGARPPYRASRWQVGSPPLGGATS
jgi:hypothetical protein